MLCKPLVSGFPAVLSSLGCSKENRHTCLPKQYWFPAAAVRWNNLARTITILSPHFTPCICLHRYARSIAALSVRRHYLIYTFQQNSSFDPFANQLFFSWAELSCRWFISRDHLPGRWRMFYHHSQHFCQFQEKKQDCSFKLHPSIMC